jgi:hypothetical protein
MKTPTRLLLFLLFFVVITLVWLAPIFVIVWTENVAYIFSYAIWWLPAQEFEDAAWKYYNRVTE